MACVGGCESRFETLEEDGGQLWRCVSSGSPGAPEVIGFPRPTCSASLEMSTSSSSIGGSASGCGLEGVTERFISSAVVCVDGCESIWFETLGEDGGQLWRCVSGSPGTLEMIGLPGSTCSAGPETSTPTSVLSTVNQARLNNKSRGSDRGRTRTWQSVYMHFVPGL